MKRHGNTSATNNKQSWTIVFSDRATNSPTVSGGLMNNQKPPLFESERGAKMLTLRSIYQNKKSVHESKNWVRQGIDR
jgi:hypothetical protein